MDFQITTGSSVPLYRQIVDQVRRAVSTGELEAGAQLPSVRALAELLVINPNTVARAYAELAREGVVESQAGRGLFVTSRRQVFSTLERQRRLEIALDVFLNEVLFLDFEQHEIVEMVKAKLQELDVKSSQRKQKEAGK